MTNMHEDYARNVYREEEMPEYFGDVIEYVIKKIDHGDVCDLGSHAIGHYWAMGYIERVQSYSCYDLSREALDIMQKTLDNWESGDIRKKHGYYLQYLREKNVIEAADEEIETQIRTKLADVRQFDFLKDTPDRKYDIVMANESLPVVDDFDQFLKAMQTCYDFLKPGGLLLTVSGQYERVTSYISEMQDHKIEGRLNPGAADFTKAMKQTGFKEIETKTIPVTYPDYIAVDICSARKGN